MPAQAIGRFVTHASGWHALSSGNESLCCDRYRDPRYNVVSRSIGKICVAVSSTDLEGRV